MQDYTYENETETEACKTLDQVKAAALLAIDFGYEFLKEVAQKPLEKGEAVIDKVEEKGKKVIEKAGAKGTEVVAKGVEKAIDHPFVTLLTAFGLGFILVKLLKRKK